MNRSWSLTIGIASTVASSIVFMSGCLGGITADDGTAAVTTAATTGPSTVAATSVAAGGNCGDGGGGGGVSVSVTVGVSGPGVTVAATGVGGGLPSGCEGATPVGPLHEGSATAATSTGAGNEVISCVHIEIDAANNEWESTCDHDGCDCRMNGMTLCSCSFGSPQSCSHDTCCPDPWSAP